MPGDRPGPVNAVELKAKRATRALAGNQHVDAVCARLFDVNGVDQPLARPGPSNVELSTCRLTPLEVNAGFPISRFLLLLVLRIQVVVSDPFIALVEILELDRAGDDVDLPHVGTREAEAGILADGGGAAGQRQ